MIPSPPSLLLWLTLVLCAPIPFYLVETGQQPLAGLLQIFGVMVTLMLTEGTGGQVTTAAWILGVQIVLGFLLLTIATIGLMRLLRSLLGHRSTIATYVLVALIAWVAATQPIYRTPFRAKGIQSTLSQVFE